MHGNFTLIFFLFCFWFSRKWRGSILLLLPELYDRLRKEFSCVRTPEFFTATFLLISCNFSDILYFRFFLFHSLSSIVFYKFVLFSEFIVIIRDELGLDRPVSASSDSRFKDIPSRLLPFGLLLSITSGILFLFIPVTRCSQFDLYLLSF